MVFAKGYTGDHPDVCKLVSLNMSKIYGIMREWGRSQLPYLLQVLVGFASGKVSIHEIADYYIPMSIRNTSVPSLNAWFFPSRFSLLSKKNWRVPFPPIHASCD